MKLRVLGATLGLAVALVTAGCATSIAGQAETVAGAVVTNGATSDDSTSDDSTSTSSADDPKSDIGSSAPSSAELTEVNPSGGDLPSQPLPPAGTTVMSTGTPVESPVPTSIPGLPADCNKVLAGITAFSSVLQGASSGTADTTISPAAVEAALAKLPASGLPAQPQADVTILRATLKGAAGKTITELAITLTDGKVVAALEDLSTWASKNCA